MENKSGPRDNPRDERTTESASEPTNPDVARHGQAGRGPDSLLQLEGRPGRLKRETRRVEVRPGDFREVQRITLPDRPTPAMGADSWVEKHLTPVGRDAFEELCRLGCKRETLGGLFRFLSAKPISLQRKSKIAKTSNSDQTDATAQHAERSRGAPETAGDDWYEVAIHALDRLETSLRGSGKVDIRALERTAQRARKLAKEIEALKRTSFVRWLQKKGYINLPDLLSGPLALPVRTYFRGLVYLPRWAKQIGARKRPDFERQLQRIFQHICEETADWHDNLVEHILYDLFPSHRRTDPNALLRWRSRHGLKRCAKRP